MAVFQTGKEFNTKNFIGLSTDIKPINCGAGSKFYESDTNNVYIFNAVGWLFFSSANEIDGGAF